MLAAWRRAATPRASAPTAGLARPRSLAGELGWRSGPLAEALACDVVVTVTPGSEPVADAADLRPGQHLAVLGADAHGKAELTPAAIARCDLFCDQWEQASAGGELAGAVAAGCVGPDDVTDLGAVLDGTAPGRTSRDQITLFDSTGLTIQNLGIAIATVEAWRAGAVEAAEIGL